MKTDTVTLSQDKNLYCIPCGNGFSCLGIDRCNNLAVHLARELANRGYKIPMPAAVGTLERYEQYRQFCEWAKQENQKNGFRSTGNPQNLRTVKYYKTFKRSCNTLEEFAKARKITVDTGLTEDQAREQCREFNNNRTPAQIRKGTKMEFTAQ